MYKTSFKTILFLLLLPLMGWAQEGVVTGILTTDSDGLPLPGANIIVKGTRRGAQTDFDGKYSIRCNIGEILVVSYVGMKDREILVTSDMFGYVQFNHVERIPVENIESDDYRNAIKSITKELFQIPSITDAKHIYNHKDNYNALTCVKDINIKPENVEVTYFKPDIYFQAGLSSALSFQYVKDNNLPELQSTFSQGAPENGSMAFLGPETGNIFSYGPNLNTLEFDGSNYDFDNNGRLVPQGTGNGIASNSYNNSIYNTAINTLNNLFFDVESYAWVAGIDYTHSTSEDLFGRVRNKKDDLTLSYNNMKYFNRKFGWKAFIKYNKWVNNQPNINGFTNNLLLNSLVTPVSFDNDQGTVLPDNSQRSFSPTNYNNPNWLLDHNRNRDLNSLFVASFDSRFEISDQLRLNSQIDYNVNKNEQRFGLVRQTVGFEDGYLSHKNIDLNSLNATFNLKYLDNSSGMDLDASATASFRNEDLNYRFEEAFGFDAFTFSNPQNTTVVSNQINRSVLQLNKKLDLSYYRHFEFSVYNNIYISSIQENAYFLPAFELNANIAELTDMGIFYDFYLSFRGAKSVKDMSLFYNNQSHNSLQLMPSESLGYTSNIDLFINDNISLEEKQDYSFSLDIEFELNGGSLELATSYFLSKTENSVFPVLENGSFELQNIANIRNRGLEVQLKYLDWSFNAGYGFNWVSTLNFMMNRNEVLNLHGNQERVPIAGFQNVSKNLIVGETAGIIVGSAYARDSEDNVIIDSNGYPLLDPEQQIIGDPQPDFTIGFTNSFEWGDLKFKFVLDYQKGGDVWNGTQNVLNYFGTSQQSADQRGITNFVFNGVNEQGNPNTIPVDFYDPASGIQNNRFVRYGFSGVAEDAIEDASYLNVRSLELSYDFADGYQNFFRVFEVALYANNLFTFTKFRGASPNSSLFDTNSGNNLNFFNTPLITEVGLKVYLKI